MASHHPAAAAAALIIILGLAAPGAFAQPPATPAAARSEEARADAVIAAFPGFSGAVAVSRDGQVVFRKAYGEANRELSVPNTPETRFRIGSVTKQFTAVAILQLAEAGKLKLDDPVSKYYPDAPATWAPITIHHLLTHTSGIRPYTGLPNFFATMSREDRTPEKVIELTRDMPLASAPGAQYAYNNTGYVILGLVIEKASGETYADYVQKHIFTPVGMTNSGYDMPERIVPKRAAGYEMRPGGIVNTPYLAMSLPYAAGSLYSTVDDLLLWDRALRDGKLLAPASYALMFKDHGFRYGYGWQIDRQYGHDRVMHGGGINGFAAGYARYPSQKLAIAVLSNFGNGPSGPIVDRLAAVYLNVPPRTAAPGGEERVRNAIASVIRGEPNYNGMSPALAAATRQQLPALQRSWGALGELKTVTLVSAELDGFDLYRLEFANGVMEYRLKMGENGIVESAQSRITPPRQ